MYYYLSRAMAYLGSAYAPAGCLPEALPLLEQAQVLLEQARATGTGSLTQQARIVALLSEAYRLAGRLDEARQGATRALSLARTHQERGSEAWTLRLLGDLAAQEPDVQGEAAASYYEQALALAEELGMRTLQAHCQRGLGTLYARQGQRQQARAALIAAIDLYRDMEMTF
jgi:tetratricopeptide (TPR) repeat protein